MRDWKARKVEYLAALFRTEGPVGCVPVVPGTARSDADMKCLSCGTAAGAYRCLSCWGHPLMCRSCCIDGHQLLPFHRVESLQSAGHFEPTTLGELGLQLRLGGKGVVCDCGGGAPDPSAPDKDAENIDSDEEDEDEDGDDPDVVGAFFNTSYHRSRDIGKNMIVVDVTGVHLLPVKFCRCEGSAPDDIQLLQNHLYPSTQRAVRTCFTFDVLDAFLLENVECKTTASAFFSRLQRQTDPIFPYKVPVGAPVPYGFQGHH